MLLTNSNKYAILLSDGKEADFSFKSKAQSRFKKTNRFLSINRNVPFLLEGKMRNGKGQFIKGNVSWSKSHSELMPRGKYHYGFGKKLSKKICEKMSDGQKNSLKAIEWRKKLHKNNIGRPAWNKGKKLGYIPTKAFKKGHIPYCKIHPEIMLKGKNNPAWKGGITPLTKIIRYSSEAYNWRKKVFERDNFTCQDCHIKGGILHPHHKKEFSIILKEFLQEYSQFSPIEDKETLVRLAITYKPFWEISNGKTLCKECHYAKYSISNKNNT